MRSMNLKKLTSLLKVRSKHSGYQALHPLIRSSLGVELPGFGKEESARWAYIMKRSNLAGKTVLDIGSNAGYFAIAASC